MELERVRHSHGSDGAPERAIQTVRRLANTFLDAARSKTKLAIPYSHPLVSWALKHSCCILSIFHKHGATQKTAFELMTGFLYSGTLVALRSIVLAKRLKVKHQGDRIWNANVFLGKTESDLWLIGQPDGVDCVRPAIPLAEAFDAERTNNLSTHLHTHTNTHFWEIKQTVLGTSSRVQA